MTYEVVSTPVVYLEFGHGADLGSGRVNAKEQPC